MYTVDGRDRVVSLEDVPQSCVGAPMPVVFSDEYSAIVVYITRDAACPGVDDNAFVAFRHRYALMAGPPNDEAFAGHPLAARGLRPYGAFRVEDSSWIRQLERMNAVHPHHDPERFWDLTHYILSFHDSTVECVAGDYTVSVLAGQMQFLLGDIDRVWKSIYDEGGSAGV